MVVETIYSRKEYKLNVEDIKKFKEMFGIKGTIKEMNIITSGENFKGEEWLNVLCHES